MKIDDIRVRTDCRYLFDVVRQERNGTITFRGPEVSEEKLASVILCILCRVPLPPFYASELPDGVRSVRDPDGILKSLLQIASNNRLVPYIDMPGSIAISGKMLSDAPPMYQNRILDLLVTIHTFDYSTPQEAFIKFGFLNFMNKP